MDNCPRCGYVLAREASMNEWISIEDYLPEDKQVVDVLGIACGQTEETILEDLKYFESVGFITNITHWRPHES